MLNADVDAITTAAKAWDATAVQRALKRLRAHVEQQQKAGELTPARAERIIAAGARVALDAGIPAPQIIVSPVPVRAPTPEKDEDDDDDKEDKEEDEKDEDD